AGGYSVYRVTPQGEVTLFPNISGTNFDGAQLFRGQDDALYATQNGQILRILTNGTFTVFATFDDNVINQTFGQISSPMAQDADGNFFCQANNEVYKISPAGVITPFAPIS